MPDDSRRNIKGAKSGVTSTNTPIEVFESEKESFVQQTNLAHDLGLGEQRAAGHKGNIGDVVVFAIIDAIDPKVPREASSAAVGAAGIPDPIRRLLIKNLWVHQPDRGVFLGHTH